MPAAHISFIDDIALSDHALLYRRVSPANISPELVDDNGIPQLRSAAFQDYNATAAAEHGLPGPCMSVAIAEIVIEYGHPPEKLLEGYDGYGLAQLTVEAVRTLSGPGGENWSQGIMLDPTESEPWHAVVFSTTTNKKTKGMKAALSQAAKWRIPPP